MIDDICKIHSKCKKKKIRFESRFQIVQKMWEVFEKIAKKTEVTTINETDLEKIAKKIEVTTINEYRSCICHISDENVIKFCLFVQ